MIDDCAGIRDVSTLRGVKKLMLHKLHYLHANTVAHCKQYIPNWHIYWCFGIENLYRSTSPCVITSIGDFLRMYVRIPKECHYLPPLN